MSISKAISFDTVDRPVRPETVRTGRPLPVAWMVAGVLFIAYAAVSVQRHLAGKTSGYDLGIFEQEVSSWAHWHLPISTLKGPGYERLGDHFSPVTAVLAPFYAVFSSPVTLLIAQALLLAVAAVPLVGWAARAIGPGVAVAVGVVYGLFWGIAGAVTFDFHEVAFAVPLLAFSLAALGQGRLRVAVWWAAPLVLVKEDLGLTLAVIGVLVAWRGDRVAGAAAAVGGVVATAVEMAVIIPAFNPSGENSYTHQVDELAQRVFTVFSPDTKIVTLVMILLPTVFLAVRSPLLAVAAPTIAWRFLADNPVYWGTMYHYSAVLAPIVIAAFIDALTRRPDRTRMWWVTAATIVTVLMVPKFSFGPIFTASFWQVPTQVTATHQLLSQIPDGTTVSASNWLAPQLTNRTDVSLFGMTSALSDLPDYIVVDTAEAQNFPISAEQQLQLLQQARADGYVDIGQAGPVFLLQRR